MKKKVLILCPHCYEGTRYPIAKEMFALANELSDFFDVTLLTQHVAVPAAERKKRKFKSVEFPNQFRIFSRYLKWMESRNPFLRRFAERKIKGMIPTISYKDLKKWARKNKGLEYDVLISVSLPFYPHKMAMLLRSILHIKRWFTYIVDPYADNQLFSQADVAGRVNEETEIFENCSEIFSVKLIYDRCVHSKIRQYREKVHFVPDTFVWDRTAYNNAVEKKRGETIEFYYMGQFIKEIRDPEHLFCIFSHLPDFCNLNLYYRGCAETVEQYSATLKERMRRNDYISDPEEYNRVVGSADVLISIGNTIDNQVPSKIYEYCSFGKPIIHFYSSKNDIVLKNFEKYPLIKFIDYHTDSEEAAKEILRFSKENVGKKVAYSEIQEIFSDYTLDYVIKLLKEKIEE